MNEQMKNMIVNRLTSYHDFVLSSLNNWGEFVKLCGGDKHLSLQTVKGEETNIIVLMDVSDEFRNTFKALHETQIIKLSSCNEELIAIDNGQYYPFPIAKSVKVFKEPRWMPMLVQKGYNFIPSESDDF
jgi:hypothetical protein